MAGVRKGTWTGILLQSRARNNNPTAIIGLSHIKHTATAATVSAAAATATVLAAAAATAATACSILSSSAILTTAINDELRS